jgi:heptosyltransferase-3
MTYGDYPDLSGVKRILVVKLRHLGDVLLTGAVFHALKKAIPKASIDAYVYEEARPMLEGHPALSEILGYDRKWKKLGLLRRLGRELGMLLKIRAKKYDLVINLTEGDRGALAARAARARIRTGFDPKGNLQRTLYTHVVKHCPGVRHTVERNLDALRRIGIFPEERELFFHVPDAAREAMRKRAGEGFVLIHPTSRWRFKCWPVLKMRELIERLERRGKKIVITSGPDPAEKEMAQAIGRGFGAQVLAGEISLKELGALIELSEVLLCVDSVPLHMASALKKPVVAIFGPTSDAAWGPWRNPRAKVVAQNISCRPCYQDGCGGSKYSDCLHTLPVERVLEALDSEVLSEVGAPRLRICEELVDRSR